MSLNYKTTSAVELHHIIKEMGNDLLGLELGVWYGVNIGHILEECSNVKLLIGVDPYQPYQDWNRYIDQNLMDQAYHHANVIVKGFGPRAELIKSTSLEVSSSFNQKLDFIFIDGDHSFDRCYEDLNLWYEKVKSGGLFSGHDFTLPGVNKAINQFRSERKIRGFFKVIPNDVWYWIKD